MPRKALHGKVTGYSSGFCIRRQVFDANDGLRGTHNAHLARLEGRATSGRSGSVPSPLFKTATGRLAKIDNFVAEQHSE